mmetsp:Transcript_5783/g.21036  ORF Transcript_5783/g.21036 Transcript_5783/m.21036 type:complete len:587 (-) Transcript_5783:851-2611(-)
MFAGLPTVQVVLPKYTQAQVLGIFGAYLQDKGFVQTQTVLAKELQYKGLAQVEPSKRPSTRELDKHVAFCIAQLQPALDKRQKSEVAVEEDGGGRGDVVTGNQAGNHGTASEAGQGEHKQEQRQEDGDLPEEDEGDIMYDILQEEDEDDELLPELDDGQKPSPEPKAAKASKPTNDEAGPTLEPQAHRAERAQANSGSYANRRSDPATRRAYTPQKPAPPVRQGPHGSRWQGPSPPRRDRNDRSGAQPTNLGADGSSAPGFTGHPPPGRDREGGMNRREPVYDKAGAPRDGPHNAPHGTMGAGRPPMNYAGRGGYMDRPDRERDMRDTRDPRDWDRGRGPPHQHTGYGSQATGRQHYGDRQPPHRDGRDMRVSRGADPRDDRIQRPPGEALPSVWPPPPPGGPPFGADYAHNNGNRYDTTDRGPPPPGGNRPPVGNVPYNQHASGKGPLGQRGGTRGEHMLEKPSPHQGGPGDRSAAGKPGGSAGSSQPTPAPDTKEGVRESPAATENTGRGIGNPGRGARGGRGRGGGVTRGRGGAQTRSTRSSQSLPPAPVAPSVATNASAGSANPEETAGGAVQQRKKRKWNS